TERDWPSGRRPIRAHRQHSLYRGVRYGRNPEAVVAVEVLLVVKLVVSPRHARTRLHERAEFFHKAWRLARDRLCHGLGPADALVSFAALQHAPKSGKRLRLRKTHCAH